MLTLTSRDNQHTETKNVKLLAAMSIEFTFDGGRVGVTIDGETVFYSMMGGNDFKIVIDNSQSR